jgi:ABC-type phosphate transport system substrate-binding protein
MVRTRRIAVTAAAVVVLAGCGGASEAASTSTTATTRPSTTTTTTRPRPTTTTTTRPPSAAAAAACAELERIFDLMRVDPAAGGREVALFMLDGGYTEADLIEASDHCPDEVRAYVEMQREIERQLG